MPIESHRTSLKLTLELWHNSACVVFTYDPNGPQPDDCPHVVGEALESEIIYTIDGMLEKQKLVAHWMKEGERLNMYESMDAEETFINFQTKLKKNGQLKYEATLGLRDPESGDLLADPPPLVFEAIWDEDNGAEPGGMITTSPYPAFRISYPSFQMFKDRLDDFIGMIPAVTVKSDVINHYNTEG